MRSSLKSYILGFVALVAALLLRWLLDPLMGDALPLVTLFGAVAAAVWLGGYRLAIPVALLGYVACHYLFIPREAKWISVSFRGRGRISRVSLHLCSNHLFRRGGAYRAGTRPPATRSFSSHVAKYRRRSDHHRYARTASPISTKLARR